MIAARIDIPLEKIRDFCARWKITEFALFGSVLREDFRTDSDVDVLISFEANVPWTYFDYVQMKDELRVIFSRKVDLVTKRSLKNPYRRADILRTHRVVYAA